MICLTLACPACAQTPATQPAPRVAPATATTQPDDMRPDAGPRPAATASTQPAPSTAPASDIDPAVRAVLDQLEAQSADTQTLNARVSFSKVQGIFDEEQVRFADFQYLAATGQQINPRFAVRFDGLRLGGKNQRLETIDERFVFDGFWLLDLDARKKQATRRQLLAPGERLDMMSNETFPVPLDVNADRVLRRYRVTLLPAPQGSVALELVPLPRPSNQPAKRVAMTFLREADRLIPQQARVTEDNGDITTVNLMEVQINRPLPRDAFDTRLPRGGGWETQVVPLTREAS